MTAFCDRLLARELGMELSVHINESPQAEEISIFVQYSERCHFPTNYA